MERTNNNSADSLFNESSADTLLNCIISVIDDRIEKRLGQSDIMHLYDGKITKIYNDNSALVKYDDYEYEVINAMGVAFTQEDINTYVKFGTADGINHVCLYRIIPKSVNIDDIKEMKDKLSDIEKDVTSLKKSNGRT